VTTFVWTIAVLYMVRVAAGLLVIGTAKFPVKSSIGETAFGVAIRTGLLVWALVLLL